MDWFAPSFEETNRFVLLLHTNRRLQKMLNSKSLLKLDVNVIMEKIQVNSSAPWNPKTDARAAHVYCATNQEDQVNKVLISMYNKKRWWMHMQTICYGDLR